MLQSPPPPLLGPSVPVGDPFGIPPLLASQRVPAGDPQACTHSHHIRLGNSSNIIRNDSPQRTQYCLLWAPPNQTSQEVSHPGTTLAEACLTAEF
jgi:hypothetical protein